MEQMKTDLGSDSVYDFMGDILEENFESLADLMQKAVLNRENLDEMIMSMEKHLSDDFRNLFMKHIPLDRMGLPEEIAEAVCYFASDASSYVTGQILAVSGGFGLATPLFADISNIRTKR